MNPTVIAFASKQKIHDANLKELTHVRVTFPYESGFMIFSNQYLWTCHQAHYWENAFMTKHKTQMNVLILLFRLIVPKTHLYPNQYLKWQLTQLFFILMIEQIRWEDVFSNYGLFGTVTNKNSINHNISRVKQIMKNHQKKWKNRQKICEQ